MIPGCASGSELVATRARLQQAVLGAELLAAARLALSRAAFR